MPKMDLRQNYRYTDCTLYRAGKGVDVPDHVAAWMRGKTLIPVTPDAPPSSPQTGEQQEVGLPDDYPYREILDAGKFKSHAQVQAASDADLIALDGIGPARLRELRAYEPAA